MADPGETVYAIDPLPIHLWQRNPNEQVNVQGRKDVAYNAMGCGAYTTTMAMSVLNRELGNYQFATNLYAKMRKVPFSRGTWEGENAKQAQQQGYVAAQLHNGTAEELANLVRLNASAVLNVDPKQILFIKYGAHDVTLSGFSTNNDGKVQKIFVLDPWIEAGAGSIGGREDYPANRYFVTDTSFGEKLKDNWTGTFTPIFRNATHAKQWLAQHPNRAAAFGVES